MKTNRRAVLAIVAGWTMLLAGQAALAQETLTMTVVKGDDAKNDISSKTAEGIAIRVTSAGKAVPNVKVTVIFPAAGPSLTTADGKPTASFNTDASGEVVFQNLKPNAVAGDFEITALANDGGRAANIHVKQHNVNLAMATAAAVPPASPAAAPAVAPASAPPPASAAKPAPTKHSHTLIIVGIAIAVGAAVGVVVATRKSSK